MLLVDGGLWKRLEYRHWSPPPDCLILQGQWSPQCLLRWMLAQDALAGTGASHADLSIREKMENEFAGARQAKSSLQTRRDLADRPHPESFPRILLEL